MEATLTTIEKEVETIHVCPNCGEADRVYELYKAIEYHGVNNGEWVATGDSAGTGNYECFDCDNNWDVANLVEVRL